MEALIGGEDGGQEVFVVAIGFAQEAFDAVAIHGAAQLALGYAQQYFYRRLAARLYAPVDGTQRIDRGGVCAVGKERFDVFGQTEVFGLTKNYSASLRQKYGKLFDCSLLVALNSPPQ